jgi:predicted metallo-beta-lactamase superfamily hydrolase
MMMEGQLQITPLAAESMGSRSMATFVETGDINLLIDPGANVGSYRYGLSPHPLETWCMKKHRERIQLYAASADVIIITHYHFDHFIPELAEMYQGKILLVKDPNKNINLKQRKRAFAFLQSLKKRPSEVRYIDGKEYDFGATRLFFSPPVPHGENDLKGHVIEVAVQKGERKFLFTSDVQGPCHDASMEFIFEQSPDILYLDGPVTYLQEHQDSQESLDQILQRLNILIEKTKLISIIIDHHLLRDIDWREKIEPLYKMASRKTIEIQTAAEYRGDENNLLEARRNQLYENDRTQE